MNKGRKVSKNLVAIISLVIAIISLVITILNFFWGEGLLEKKKEKEQNEIHSALQLAQMYYDDNNYEGVASVFSESILKENAQALLDTGVMYMEGIYYSKNKKLAQKYFYKALENGETYYSIYYLLGALDENKDRKEMDRLFCLGCEYKNMYCEKILQEVYIISDWDVDTTYTEDFNKKSQKQKKKVLDKLYTTIGTYKHYSATGYDYYIEDGELIAKVQGIKEEDIPVIVSTYFLPEYKMIFN